MKLFILDEVFELENKIKSVEEIFDYIKQALEETEYHFSYMIIDGEDIHDEFELYIEDNIKFIEEIKVMMLTTKDIVKDNLITISEYVERAVPILNKLADEFYREPNSDDWKQVAELSEGIGFIFHTLESIDSMENLNEIVVNYEVWNEYVGEVRSIDQILEEMTPAIENKDTVLIGDLLSYEIVPVFEKMKEKLDVLTK